MGRGVLAEMILDWKLFGKPWTLGWFCAPSSRYHFTSSLSLKLNTDLSDSRRARFFVFKHFFWQLMSKQEMTGTEDKKKYGFKVVFWSLTVRGLIKDVLTGASSLCINSRFQVYKMGPQFSSLSWIHGFLLYYLGVFFHKGGTGLSRNI